MGAKPEEKRRMGAKPEEMIMLEIRMGAKPEIDDHDREEDGSQARRDDEDGEMMSRRSAPTEARATPLLLFFLRKTAKTFEEPFDSHFQASGPRVWMIQAVDVLKDNLFIGLFRPSVIPVQDDFVHVEILVHVEDTLLGVAKPLRTFDIFGPRPAYGNDKHRPN